MDSKKPFYSVQYIKQVGLDQIQTRHLHYLTTFAESLSSDDYTIQKHQNETFCTPQLTHFLTMTSEASSNCLNGFTVVSTTSLPPSVLLNDFS